MINTAPQLLEGSPRYFGWRVLLAAVVGLTFSPGPIMAVLLGAIAGLLQAEFGISLGQVMLSITIFSLATIAAAPVAGRLIDSMGARSVLLVSSALMAVILLLSAYAVNSILEFYIAAAVFGLLSIGAQSITYNKLLAAWFSDKRRGLVLGIAAAGLGLGYAILPSIITATLAVAGWRGAIAFLGVLSLSPLILNLIFAFPPDRQSPTAAALSVEGVSIREALRRKEFWILGAAIFLISTVSLGIAANVVSFGKDLGVKPTEIAFTASMLGIATLLARLLVGYLFDKFFAPHVVAACFAFSAVGFGILALSAARLIGDQENIVAIIFIGLAFGAESDLIGYLTSRYFGLRVFGQIYGYLYTIFVFGAATGPFAFGLGRDAFGGYTWPFLLAAVMAASAGLLMLIMPRFPEAGARNVLDDPTNRSLSRSDILGSTATVQPVEFAQAVLGNGDPWANV
jgi:MFS family permease